ncbi:uncharacterized protein Jvl isoform X2 [Vanessa tameamea]|uniref:Uncharacterized protein Jvl isoform X2 n=1 Tax=Vanessa tameamea TaxID=334116 RepID=A0ABM4AL42_VANTA
MGDKINREYFAPGSAAFNYNNVTGGADSASGGSGGSGMECLQLRSPPGPFHYLISEQAKSLVALQELQNEVGALLEFRDLVIETFPNLRSKMAPSTPASGTRRDWEPGVRVRRKLAGGSGDTARTKPQPSVQDSGFSTETSCGKDAHSSASASASASRSRPLEDELWALLDVIQRKGVRLRDEAELLRGELDERPSETAEESFARALSTGCGDCTDLVRLRTERDALLAHAAQLEAAAAASPPPAATTPLGRLDNALDTPSRPPRVPTPDSKKFAAILLESNPVELQRQLLISTVQNQVITSKLRREAAHRTVLLEKLERARDQNEDLKFRLEEKSIELEGARARVRQLEGKQSRSHSSMREMEPLALPLAPPAPESPRPSESPRQADTPRARPSRIPRHTHTAHKAAAPRPPPRPPSAHSAHSGRSARSAASTRSGGAARKDAKCAVPVRRSPSHDSKKACEASLCAARAVSLAAEYVARAERLAPLFPRLRPLPADLAYESPRNLALELRDSLRYDELWAGRPQRYFESVHARDDFDDDSLA